ncbi:MAG: nuclear transport factor 2 family protein [Nodosilinea sp.]
MDSEIRHLEERLRAAMLTSNVAELDALIDDRLLFSGPDGSVYRKADDLELHRSGAERITRLDLDEIVIEHHGEIAIAVVLTRLAGELHGQAFAGQYRYTRTWMRGEQGWRIVAGSVCAVPG